MKLTAVQIDQIKDQIGAEPVPEDAPAEGLLKSHFGDHTFYVDEVGVHVFETEDEGTVGRVIPMRVASWTDEKRQALAPHDPIPGSAGAIIELDD